MTPGIIYFELGCFLVGGALLLAYLAYITMRRRFR